MQQHRERFAGWGRGGWQVVLVWVIALFIGCDSRPQAPLRLGLFPWPGYEPIVLARDLGYFEQRPVQVMDFSSGTQVLRAFRNGAIDVAAITLDEAILLAHDIPDVKVIVTLDFSSGADVVLGHKEITSLQDLRGKRIGYESSALGSYMLSRALEHAGLQAGDVKPVSVQSDEHEKAFREGRVDAIVTFEPARGRLLAEGAKVLFDSSQIPGEIIDVLVAKESYLKAHPDMADTLLKGWFRAVKYIREHPDDASARLSVRLKVPPSGVTEVYSGLKLMDLPENRELFTASHPALVRSAQRLADHMLAQKVLLRPIQVDTLIDPGPLSRVKSE